MKPHFSLDSDPFQELLSNAFAVQASGLDRESLVAIVGLQQSIATGELDVDEALELIALRTRGIANADGIAIGLLKENQLVYRAGSGSASTYVGRHVAATLCVCRHGAANHTILRVENAQTDRRIEAAICRQFGAQALLILPISLEHVMVGMLAVIFHQAHAFQYAEVRSYRLMTGLVEEAMLYATRPEKKQTLPPDRFMQLSFREIVSQGDRPLSDPGLMSGSAPNRAIGASLAVAEKLPVSHPEAPSEHEAMRFPAHSRRWKVAAGIAVVLATSCWIAYRAASSVGVAALPTSSAIVQPAALQLVQEYLAVKPPQRLLTAGIAQKRRKAAGVISSRLPDRNYKVRYFSDDVTVRYFTPQPTQAAPDKNNHRVRRVSDDVTVRYFTPQPLPALPPDTNNNRVRPAEREQLHPDHDVRAVR